MSSRSSRGLPLQPWSAALLSTLVHVGLSQVGVNHVGVAHAQDTMRPTPLEAATASRADKPITVSAIADPDIARLVAHLTGNFRSPARTATGPGDSGEPELVYSAATVAIDGLAPCVLFQIARSDAPADPFRIGIFHAYRRKAELHLRVFDFAISEKTKDGFKDAVAGLVYAPWAFPKISPAGLNVNIDYPIKQSGDAASSTFTGATPAPVPTMRDGAFDLTSRIRIEENQLAFADAGFDSEGKQVWGPIGDAARVFKRDTGAAPVVTTSDDALTIITLVAPPANADTLVDGGLVSLHYTGFLTDGTKFDSSRSRDPFRMNIPGNLIPGWNLGLKGIAKGERRRLIIPPALGYAERGAGRVIPPGATLIFDVECLHIDNSSPVKREPPPIPPVVAPTRPTPSTPAQSAPASDSIGKPASNSSPERPR